MSSKRLSVKQRMAIGRLAMPERPPEVRATNFDICVLSCAERGFGYRHEIHIWITSRDYQNATLMILLGFIILGHPDWSKAEIRLFAVFPEQDLELMTVSLS